LAEQFRANQGMKDKVYTGNRGVLNDALLKNLAIADQQYERQAKAKSNTKEVFKGALDSMAAKIGQNRLENRQLQVGSNEFEDFSYDKNGRLRKTGAPTTFNIAQMYGPTGEPITHVPLLDKDGKVIGMQQIDQTPSGTPTSKTAEEIKKEEEAKRVAAEEAAKAAKTTARNGSLVKAFKGL